MYEAMVKEAYENILGMDKEAKRVFGPYGYEDVTGKGENVTSRPYFHKALEKKEKTDAVKNAVGEVAGKATKLGKGYLDALKATDLREIAKNRKAVADAMPGVDAKAIAETAASQGLGAGAAAKAGAKTLAAYAPIAATAIGTGVLAKKLYDKKKAQRAQEALEAAEAQKTAAENDYLEACAYEEAALEVLAELGVDIDAFEKEASENVAAENDMTVEQMDEAAFNYLAERGYFDDIEG